MESPHIIEGRRYPVKSCLPEIYSIGDTFEFNHRGPAGDREFMVVDAKSGELRTQRKRHAGYYNLSKVQPVLNDESLQLDAPGMQRLTIDLDDLLENGKTRNVAIWDDYDVGALVSAEGSKWFSDFLHQQCELVHTDARRLINRPYASPNAEVTFADRNQVHLISKATIDHFNELLSEENLTVSADNFRPNLVIDGVGDREENNLDFIKVRDVVMRSTIPCERCEMPGNDPQSGEYRSEIVKLLARHYKPHGDKGALVGEQFEVISPGYMHIGDEMHAITVRENGWARKFNKI